MALRLAATCTNELHGSQFYNPVAPECLHVTEVKRVTVNLARSGRAGVLHPVPA